MRKWILRGIRNLAKYEAQEILNDLKLKVL